MVVGGRKEDTATAAPRTVGHSTIAPVANGRLPLRVAADESAHPPRRWYVLRVVLAYACGAASRAKYGSAAHRVATVARTAPG